MHNDMLNRPWCSCDVKDRTVKKKEIHGVQAPDQTLVLDVPDQTLVLDAPDPKLTLVTSVNLLAM